MSGTPVSGRTNGPPVAGLEAKVLVDFHKLEHLKECAKVQQEGGGGGDGVVDNQPNLADNSKQASALGGNEYGEDAGGLQLDGPDGAAGAIALARYQRDALDQHEQHLKDLELQRQREKHQPPNNYYIPPSRGGIYGAPRNSSFRVGSARPRKKRMDDRHGGMEPAFPAMGKWYKLN